MTVLSPDGTLRHLTPVRAQLEPHIATDDGALASPVLAPHTNTARPQLPPSNCVPGDNVAFRLAVATAESRDASEAAAKKEWVAAIKAATAQLFQISAAPAVAATRTQKDAARLRKYMKWGTRYHFKSVAALQAECERVRRYIDALLKRLSPDERTAIEARVALSTSEKVRVRAATPPAPRAPRAPRAHVLPISLATLPHVDLLTALMDTARVADTPAGRVQRWKDALTVKPTTNAKNLSAALTCDRKMTAIIQRRALYELKGQVPTARAAMQKLLGKDPTKNETRWAQRVWQAPSIRAASVDRRWERVTSASVLCPLTKAIILSFYCGRRGASTRVLTKMVNASLQEYENYARVDGYDGPVPRVSKSSVARFIAALPEPVTVIREKGYAEFRRQGRIVDRFDEAEYANEIWEIDHTPLDIAAVRSSDEPDQIATIWATACVDAYSSLPIAVFLSSQAPDAFTTSLVLAMAIKEKAIAGVRVGGLPTILRPDHGKDFMSTHVARVAEALPIQLDPAAQHNPDGKPHVERFFRSLNEQLAEFPGYTPVDGRSDGAKTKRSDRLLTVRQVIEKVQGLVADMATRAQEKGRGTPIDRYQRTVRWREPVAQEELELLLLREGERTLTREGVRMNNILYKGRPNTGHGHTLVELVKTKVIVRFHPDIQDAIYVHTLSGERIGEFVREDLWKEQFGASAANAEALPLLRNLISGYARQLEKEDRRWAKAKRVEESEQRVAERIAAEVDFGPRLHPGATASRSLVDSATTSPRVERSGRKRVVPQAESKGALSADFYDDLPD